MDTLKACINVDHIEKFWGPSSVDADWHPFCQAIYGIEGSEWEVLGDFYDPARKDKHFGKTSDPARGVERAPIRPTEEALEKALNYLDLNADCWLETLVKLAVYGLRPRGVRHGAKDAETNRCVKLFGPIGIRGTACALLPRTGTFHGPHGEFFFIQKKGPRVLSEVIEFGPRILAETMTACALIGLHMMAEERLPFGRTGIFFS